MSDKPKMIDITDALRDQARDWMFHQTVTRAEHLSKEGSSEEVRELASLVLFLVELLRTQYTEPRT